MTYQQFLDELRQTPRDWKLRKSLHAYDDVIIQEHSSYRDCPMTAVANTLGAASYERGAGAAAGERLGFDSVLTDKLLGAADNRREHDLIMRADLLEACGLLEPVKEPSKTELLDAVATV